MSNLDPFRSFTSQFHLSEAVRLAALLKASVGISWKYLFEYFEQKSGWFNCCPQVLYSLILSPPPFLPPHPRMGPAPFLFSPWDLILEEKGGEQAICPPLARTEKMDGCRAVRMRSTFGWKRDIRFVPVEWRDSNMAKLWSFVFRQMTISSITQCILGKQERFKGALLFP